MTRVVTRTLRLAVVLLAVVSLGRRRAFIAFGLGITWLVTTVIRLDGRLGCLLFRSVLVYGLFLMRVFRALLGLGIVLLRMTTTVAGAAGAAALIACIVIARSGITGWRAAALLVFGPGVAALLNRFGAAFTALRAATLRLFSLLTWCLGFLSWLLAAVIAA